MASLNSHWIIQYAFENQLCEGYTSRAHTRSLFLNLKVNFYLALCCGHNEDLIWLYVRNLMWKTFRSQQTCKKMLCIIWKMIRIKKEANSCKRKNCVGNRLIMDDNERCCNFILLPKFQQWSSRYEEWKHTDIDDEK